MSKLRSLIKVNLEPLTEEQLMVTGSQMIWMIVYIPLIASQDLLERLPIDNRSGNLKHPKLSNPKMKAGKAHKYSLVSTNLASLVKVITLLDQRILTRVVPEEEATAIKEMKMAKMPSISSRIMILSARTVSTMLVRK